MRSRVLISIVMVLAMAFPITFAHNQSYAAQDPIIIQHFQAGGHGTVAREAIERVAELFNKSQKEIIVKVIPHTTGTYEEALAKLIAGGVPPDVANSNILADVVWGKLVTSLTPFIERDRIHSQFYPAALQFGSWGKDIFQLPLDIHLFATFYNEDLFDEAGLTNPNELHKAGVWDWDAVVKCASKITRDTNGDGVADIWGISIPAFSIGRAALFVSQAGGWYFDQRWGIPKESRVKTPEVERAFTYLFSLIHQTKVMPLEAALGWVQYNKFFAEKRLGMFFEGIGGIGVGRGIDPSFTTWDVAPVPRGPANGDILVHVDGVQLVAGSRHPDAAWKWMKFLTTNSEAAKIYFEATGRFPAASNHISLFGKLAQRDGKPRYLAAVVQQLNNVAGPTKPQIPGIASADGCFTKEMTAFLSAKQSLAATLEKIDTEFKNVLRKLGK